MDSVPVALERDGPVAHLVLDAPPRNTMDRRFFDRFARLVADELPGLAISGLVVCGRGRNFSAGADVDELRRRLAAGSEHEGGEFLLEATRAFEGLARLPYPVVAAISGACLGSGLELALACHYRIATGSAVLGLPETGFGLMPGCGGTVRLPALVGPGRAIELILSGRTLLAGEAREIGLVDAVVERAQLPAQAARLIERWPALPHGARHEVPPFASC